MPTILFTMTILTLSQSSAQIFLPNKDLECTIDSTDFWSVYKTHFLLVDLLTVIVLQTERHKFELNQFAEVCCN
jgi:hypothetical protein